MSKLNISDYVSEENVENFIKFTEDFFCDHKNEYPDVYNKFKKEMEDHFYHITPEIAIEAVSKLKRKDGLMGEKWSRDDTNEVSRQYKLAEKYPDLNPCEFYFAMNYAYAVHYYPSFTIQNFIDIAFDEIHDKNVSIKHKIKEMVEYEA